MYTEPVPDKAIEVAHAEAKEDRQHRYFQSLIKHMAEEKGYRAIIERPTDNGGRVDVGLEQNGTRVAF